MQLSKVLGENAIFERLDSKCYKTKVVDVGLYSFEKLWIVWKSKSKSSQSLLKVFVKGSLLKVFVKVSLLKVFVKASLLKVFVKVSLLKVFV